MKILSWPKQHRRLTVLAIVLLTVLGFLAYQKIALELNRRAFAQARTTIDAIYKDTVSEVGKPNNFRRMSECSHSYFGPYELKTSCGVHTDFIFGVKDKTEADDIYVKIDNIVRKYNKLLHATTAPQNGIYPDPIPGNSSTNTKINYYSFRNGLSCIFKYSYDSHRETYLKLGDSISAKTFYVTTGCNGNAKDQFYPLHTSQE